MAKSLGVGGGVSGDSTKVMTAAQGRLADMAAINRGIKKKTPDEEAKEKSRQDSLSKANRSTWLGGVDAAGYELLKKNK